MSAPISRDLRTHVTQPAGQQPTAAEPAGCSRLLRGVQVFTALTALGAAACLATALNHDRWHYALAAATLAMMAAMGAALLAGNAMLADRQDFYRRGQLDGWMRGWRGQEPDVDDPLLH